MKAMILASAALIAASPATAATISVFGFAEYGIEANFLGTSSDSLIGDTTVDTTAESASHSETLDTSRS